MSGRGLLRLLAAVALVSAAVLVIASVVVRPEQRQAVALGVAFAAGWQALVFAVSAAALPRNRLAAFGVGMLSRFLLVVVAALVVVPLLEVPPAPALLSMVTVLFATTLIEPVLLAPGAGNDRNR